MRRFLWAATLVLLGPVPMALAQSTCTKLPTQTCQKRFPAAAKRIAIGSLIYCDGLPVATVQVDFFSTTGTVKRYDCSLDVPCSNTSLPASVRTKFCS